jgi:hypothetical protein
MVIVSEVIAALQQLQQDLPVAIAIDAEGNGFKHLDEATPEYMELAPKIQRVFFEFDEGEEPILPDNNIVVLWPV